MTARSAPALLVLLLAVVAPGCATLWVPDTNNIQTDADAVEALEVAEDSLGASLSFRVVRRPEGENRLLAVRETDGVRNVRVHVVTISALPNSPSGATLSILATREPVRLLGLGAVLEAYDDPSYVRGDRSLDTESEVLAILSQGLLARGRTANLVAPPPAPHR